MELSRLNWQRLGAAAVVTPLVAAALGLLAAQMHAPQLIVYAFGTIAFGSVAATVVGGALAGLAFVSPGLRILFGREGDRLDRFAEWSADGEYHGELSTSQKLRNAVFFVAGCGLGCAFLTVAATVFTWQIVQWALELPGRLTG